MAQMRGQKTAPSVPESDNNEGLWGVGAKGADNFGARVSAPIGRYALARDALARYRGPSSIVMIGDRPYREVDDGRANILVPVDLQPISPEEQEVRRRAGERVDFMRDHPIGSVFYDIATMANASPETRDFSLMAGGVADMAVTGFGLRARPSKPLASPKELLEPPPAGRPTVRPRPINADGQAQGVAATLTKPLLGTGTKSDRRIAPPGWQGNGRTYNEARGHLLAKRLGGVGDKRWNLVTLTQRGANTPRMSRFEAAIARRVQAGEVVDYFVKPLYRSGILPPTAVLMTATGSRGAPTGKVIANPAGRPR